MTLSTSFMLLLQLTHIHVLFDVGFRDNISQQIRIEK